MRAASVRPHRDIHPEEKGNSAPLEMSRAVRVVPSHFAAQEGDCGRLTVEKTIASYVDSCLRIHHCPDESKQAGDHN